MRFPLVTRKRYERELEEEQVQADLVEHQYLLTQLELQRHLDFLGDFAGRWTGHDGKVVLNSLQAALNMIKDYQRNLSTLQAADPQYRDADELLELWGVKPYKQNRIVLGFKEPGGSAIIDHAAAEAKKMLPRQEEEQKWGAEAYGTETIEIIAERTEDGDKVHFVPTEQRALEAYSSVTGYDPGTGASDDGTDIVPVHVTPVDDWPEETAWCHCGHSIFAHPERAYGPDLYENCEVKDCECKEFDLAEVV